MQIRRSTVEVHKHTEVHFKFSKYNRSTLTVLQKELKCTPRAFQISVLGMSMKSTLEVMYLKCTCFLPGIGNEFSGAPDAHKLQ